jgi:hypothetical protein
LLHAFDRWVSGPSPPCPTQTPPPSAEHPVNLMVRIKIAQPATPVPLNISITSRDCRTECRSASIPRVTKVTSEVRPFPSRRFLFAFTAPAHNMPVIVAGP